MLKNKKSMVSVHFLGLRPGTNGWRWKIEERLPIELPNRFTYSEAKQSAKLALLDAGFKRVEVLSVAFN